MWLYGDPCERLTLEDAIARTRLPDLHAALVEAGRLEQALADEGSPLLVEAARRTDLLADRLLGIDAQAPEGFAAGTSESLRLKLPEGFAFYALYPEQYVSAIEAWAKDRPNGRALVVGVRSIGTTLSAVVAAALRRLGWEAFRTTVRPSGDPFDRRMEPIEWEGREPDFILVTDEGPGQSGSSMASVGEALLAAGFPFERIVFLPGHRGLPGGMGSERTRWWWTHVERRVTPAGELCWDGRGLGEVLALETAEAMRGEVVGVDDLSGGAWREGDEPACPPLERPKLRVRLADGRAALWKFEGLGVASSRVRDARARLSGLGWCPPPLGERLGYVGYPWTEGRRLSRGDAEWMGPWLRRYVEDASGAAANLLGDFRRLRENTVDNVREAFGEEAARVVERLGQVAAGSPPDDRRTYGDGRIAPHEWILGPDSRPVKTDVGGHDRDHTYVGQQSVAWDYAALAVEWGISSGDGPWVRFHEIAYAAFRLAQIQLSPDAVREEIYRQEIEGWL